ncbi:MAG: beta-lactamase family protein [Candidatus Zixiibacteriota bacterium]|nr:MAG: beta-lactamase family protein [candidate division Zixibacteria bacterium]
MSGRNRIRPVSFVLASMAVLILLVIGCGEKKAPETTGKTPVDSELAGRLQSILNDYRESTNIKGISAAVILPENRIWLGATGMSSKTDSITTDMLFGIGSVTKSYIAALTLKYVEEGKISLDDKIGSWLSDMEYIEPSVTVRQLLNHSSGLFNYMAHSDYGAALLNYPDTLWTRDELLNSFLRKPTFKPGGGWGYSSTNYILLGMIIEKITGSSVSGELKERVLGPLGLTNTYLYPEEIYPAERMAHLWWPIDTTGVPEDINELVSPPPLKGLFSSVWTAGAIHATAEDVALWMESLFNNRVLSESLFTEMITPSELSGRFKYGFGILISTIDNKPAYGHSGGIGHSSLAYYIPETSIGIALLGNSDARLFSLAVNLYEACVDKGEEPSD